MTLTQRRKAAIEDLFDRYYQRGDVDTITVSSIPSSTTGIHLFLTCPSIHGMQRAHEALALVDATTNAASGGGKGGDGSGGINKDGDDDAQQQSANAVVPPNAGNNPNMMPSVSSQYLADSGETEEDRREKHVVRCGVETVLQLAKFKQANLDAPHSSVAIHSQYANFLMTQFVAGPLLVTLCAKRTEGRSLGLLSALAAEIKAEPVFKAFEAAAVEARVGG